MSVLLFMYPFMFYQIAIMHWRCIEVEKKNYFITVFSHMICITWNSTLSFFSYFSRDQIKIHNVHTYRQLYISIFQICKSTNTTIVATRRAHTRHLLHCTVREEKRNKTKRNETEWNQTKNKKKRKEKRALLSLQRPEAHLSCVYSTRVSKSKRFKTLAPVMRRCSGRTTPSFHECL